MSAPPAIPTASAAAPAQTASAPAPVEPMAPDIVQIGAGESVVVAPGQMVQGEWFRVAVFGDKPCGNSLNGGTLHGIDFFYDNLTPHPTRLFSKSASVELVNARAESFVVAGGLLPSQVCGAPLLLAEGAGPGARLRGWPFAGLPAASEAPTQVRLVLEEPHGFAISTVIVDLGLPRQPDRPLPARSQVLDAASDGSGPLGLSSPYFEVSEPGLRACVHKDDPWIDRVIAEGKADGQSLRIVGLDLRLLNKSREAVIVTGMEAVDADGHAYSVYPTKNTSCELGRFPEQLQPQTTGKGTIGFAIIPAGTRGLSARVNLSVVGKSPYDGYKPLPLRIALGDLGP